MQIFTVIFLFLFPLLGVWVARKLPALNAIIVCYAGGILLGNLAPGTLDREMTKSVAEGVVILALPMLLFSADFKKWLSNPGQMLKAYLFLVISVIAAALIVFYLFKDTYNAGLVTAMYSGVISGGTPNLNAIGVALEASEKYFVLLNGYDVILSGSYFFLLISVVRPLLLKVFSPSVMNIKDVKDPAEQIIFTKGEGKGLAKLKGVGLALLAGLGVLSVVVGTSFVIFRTVNPLFVIISSSTFGVMLSFVKKIRALPLTFETGDYLLLTFAVGMGYLVRFDQLLDGDFSSFYLCASIFGLMLFFHLFLCKAFRIDVDHFMISSTAGVFGPPFIGPVANATGNRALIGPGVAVAVIGHASGTYLGVLIYGILS